MLIAEGKGHQAREESDAGSEIGNHAGIGLLSIAGGQPRNLSIFGNNICVLDQGQSSKPASILRISSRCRTGNLSQTAAHGLISRQVDQPSHRYSSDGSDRDRKHSRSRLNMLKYPLHRRKCQSC